MIDRQGGKILVECDTCDEVLETETGDFGEARTLMRRECWVSRPVGGDWVHLCPDCAARD